MVGVLGIRVNWPISKQATVAYLTFVGVFLVHQLTQWLGIHFRLADHYLDPFLAVPVMMGTALITIRWMAPSERVHPITTAIFTVGLIVFFESGLFQDEKLHPDLWDIPGYVIGAGCFEWLINRRA